MHYINSKAIKELALHVAKETRPAWGAQRVSKRFLERINAHVRALVTQEIQRHPSVGKTIC
jgi:hypothetical protein